MGNQTLTFMMDKIIFMQLFKTILDGTELSLVAVLYHSRNEQDVQHDVQAEPRDVKKYILHFFGGDQHELQQVL